MLNASKSNNFLYKIRFPFLLFAIIALITGIIAGLQRIGWPINFYAVPIHLHGPLMVSGFLGTLIGMERAVALNKSRGYLAPFSAFLGIVFLLIQPSTFYSPLLMIFSSFVLTLILFSFWNRHRELHFLIMMIAPLFWLVGNVFWAAGYPLSRVAIWWAGFLIFTIAGERLELSRIMQLTPGKRVSFISFCAIALLGMVLSVFYYTAGIRIFSLGMLGFCFWLLRYDLVRLTIRKSGLTKFVAVSLLLGYLWLGAAGTIGLIYGGVEAGPIYDAFLHAIFLGFTFSMIFGHAPIIFPAILKKQITFYPFFYLHLFLLHASLLLRVYSDVAFFIPGRLWGAMFNGAAIVLFFLVTIFSIISTNYKVTGET
jgi:hypothetical protein